MKISQLAFDMTVAFEVTSPAYYTRHYQRPVLPSSGGVVIGSSGVTVGVGYDLGQASPDKITEDWHNFVDADMLAAMLSCSGFTGLTAIEKYAEVKNKILIPWNAAITVFAQRDVPQWTATVIRAVPGADKLTPSCLGVLFDLAYNRGAGGFNSDSERFREMRAIRDAVASGRLDQIPAEILSMKRLWPNIRGLLRRCDQRIALWQKGMAETDQVAAEAPVGPAIIQPEEVPTMGDAVRCIDISHWQGSPDFERVRAAGVIACIMKATEGTSYADPNRARNYINATRAGIKCCTYHWLSPGRDVKAQMDHFIGTINPVPGERMVIDYEEAGCTLDDLRQAVQALLDDRRGLRVTVYSGHLLKGQLGDERDEFLAKNTDLWLAQYTTGTPTWPDKTYPKWTLWQYSERGVVDGITGSAVDLNRFGGTDEELLKWIGPATPVKPVEPVKPHDGTTVPISIALTVPDHVALTLTVNGKVIMKETPI